MIVDTSKLPWLRGMSHNGRVVTMTEPFWSIPFNMFTVYAVLYMMELGLTERQIGLTQTVLVGTQILSSLISGSLTDRLGRKKTTVIFDMISWMVACLVWATSRSIVGFLIAAVLNGINKVVYVSFTCMVTEDATSSQRLRNYSGLHFMVLTGGFFAPLAGLIVADKGIIGGTRLIYLGSAVIMGLMFLVRNILWTEPVFEKEEKHTGMLRGLSESLSYFLADRQRIITFVLQAVVQFFYIFKPLFYFAYLKDVAGLKSGFISIVPMVISLITMIVLLGIMPRVKNRQRKTMLTTGFLAGSLSLLLLLLSPGHHWSLLLFSVLLDGMSAALIRPLLDSLWADHLDNRKRTRQLAAGNLLFGLLSIPAGSIAAEMYSLSPYLPFGTAGAILLLSGALSLTLRRHE
ncbi:MFS transporter [Spirochaeta isovalerica]|uniref:MFS family permease n=1 Tax=Spirochaeta isovalerica TaxID=150 RepID=A0A841RC76_9SPIO|nr:MFS transporter [Spirochaeta isovalerica]MBB6480981.1 MFS family permease [Spirochaeta isovalerica]